ncbi:hypothetical protein NA57DRAFT_75002 [Rhizodiscina lignyota]|uniref:Uncharacterized protein n=1 Tax=Rhizodiscina lignyota TaxID=1504668 RepID=A0A9P4IH20_9PEZI|nr:hypothetical protein NA57DRAFT_75002 [Rhizodiscina lignyota]
MTSLQGKENILEYPSERGLTWRKVTRRAQHSRELSQTLEALNEPGGSTRDPRILSAVAPTASQLPFASPLKVKKTRKQRNVQDGSYGSTASQDSYAASSPSREPQFTLNTRRGGPSFTRFNLRRKFSAQELVTAVKEAYRSRPSLNLSRIKLSEGNIPQRPLDDFFISGRSYSSTFQRQRVEKNLFRNAARPTQVLEDLSVSPGAVRITRNHGNDGKFFQRISLLHKSRHKERQSRSLDETPTIPAEPLVTRTEHIAELEDGSFMMAIPSIHLASAKPSELETSSSQTQPSCFTPKPKRKATPNPYLQLSVIPEPTSSTTSVNIGCAAVLDIAEALTHNDDRMAVFCTTGCHPGMEEHEDPRYQLHPLEKPSVHDLQRELRRITHCQYSDQPAAPPPSLDEILDCAVATLTEPIRVRNRQARDRECHVFVISSRPTINLKKIHGHEFVAIHAVCPSAIPTVDIVVPENGWVITTQSKFTPEAHEGVLPPHQALRASIRHVIRSLRTSADPGEFFDIDLRVWPGEHCSLERVVGDQSFYSFHRGKSVHISSIHQGQHVIVLLQIVVGRLSPNDDGGTFEEAVSDLELLFHKKALRHEILHVQCYYRHSSFPNDNYMCIDKPYYIDAPSIWSPSSKGKSIALAARADEQVYAPLITQVATYCQPLEALKVLQKIVAHTSLSASCLQHASAIKEELEHRQKVEMQMSKEKPRHDSVVNRDQSPALPRFSFEGPAHKWTAGTSASIPECATPEPEAGPADGVQVCTSTPTSKHSTTEVNIGPTEFVQERTPASTFQTSTPETYCASTEIQRECIPTLGTSTCSTPEVESSPTMIGYAEAAGSAEGDEAHKIWGLIRRNSKMQPHIEKNERGVENMKLIWASNIRQKEMRQRALRNRRSIGEDTLNSFTLGGGTSAEVNPVGSPWLL